ncbi:MAG: hypothetical protein MUC92_03400 [Fimbriimonadaceae bacterium]|jgi:hypothetical protein|nr:hypothetical protein [Fimbriimonadaceae bacterium]
MKRFVGVALALVLAGMVMAQQNFTIRRPAEGSTVREVVKVRFPKDSVPEGWYVGIRVNGKFLEAVLPEVEGNDYVYNLDTKARNLQDGPLSIEAILYADPGDRRPQVANRSQVNVTLDNRTSIRVPEDGFRLRYSFPVGREFIYNTEVSSSVSILSQAQAQLGSRAAEIPTAMERLRLLFAVDNAYSGASGREGLVRLQAVPPVGTDHAWLTTSGSSGPQKYYDYQMHPIFMRLSNTGREIWTAFPTYFPLEGTSGDSARTDLYAFFPLPILPERGIRPGEAFAAVFSQGVINLDEKDTKEKSTLSVDGRGVFESVEWEKGRPTAKLSVTVAQGANDLRGMDPTALGGIPQRIESKGTIWFDLSLGMVVRYDQVTTTEVLIEGGAAQGGGMGPGAGGGRGGRGGGPAPGQMGPSQPGSAQFMLPGQFDLNPSSADNSRQAGRGAPGGQPGGERAGRGRQGGGPPMGTMGGPNGGFGAGNRGAGGGAGNTRQILRQQSRISMTLE